MKECGQCNQQKDSVERRQTNTAYVEEELNWVTECAECFELTEDHWRMMWEDHGR